MDNTEKIKKIVTIGVITVGCFICGVLVSNINNKHSNSNAIPSSNTNSEINKPPNDNEVNETDIELDYENEVGDDVKLQNAIVIDSFPTQSCTIDKTDVEQISDKIENEKESKTYELVSTEAGTYRFELSNVPQNIWFYFKLYNSSMEQLQSGSGDNGDGITYELEANTKYYFVVEQGGKTGSYTLNIGSQKPIVDITEYTSINDSTQFTNQKNIYEFTSTEAGTYRFELSNVPQNIWFYFKLYNSSMEQLQSGSGDNGDGITYELEANTKYYFAVEQGGKTGSYTLNIGSQKPIVDISTYSSVNDSIQFTNQRNIYQFIPSSSDNYRFELTDTSKGVWFYFKLYNSSMEQLQSGSGDDGDGVNYELEADEKYFFVVEQGGNNGSYTLNYDTFVENN